MNGQVNEVGFQIPIRFWGNRDARVATPSLRYHVPNQVPTEENADSPAVSDLVAIPFPIRLVFVVEDMIAVGGDEDECTVVA
jgi:hypothetical protein